MSKNELRSELGDLLSIIDYCKGEPLLEAMVQEEYGEAEAAIIKLAYRFVEIYFPQEFIAKPGDITVDGIFEG